MHDPLQEQGVVAEGRGRLAPGGHQGVGQVGGLVHQVHALAATAGRAVDPHAIVTAPQSSGGEDFSWYLEHVPGAMARLGVWSGHGPQLDIHQPTFDLDERALAVGTRVMTALALGLDGPEHA